MGSGLGLCSLFAAKDTKSFFGFSRSLCQAGARKVISIEVKLTSRFRDSQAHVELAEASREIARRNGYGEAGKRMSGLRQSMSL